MGTTRRIRRLATLHRLISQGSYTRDQMRYLIKDRHQGGYSVSSFEKDLAELRSYGAKPVFDRNRSEAYYYKEPFDLRAAILLDLGF